MQKTRYETEWIKEQQHFFNSMNLNWVCTCRKWYEGLTNLFSTHQFIYIHLLHVFIASSNEWKRLEVDQWPPERFVLYHNLSRIHPWGMNLSGSSKRRWVYFRELGYFSLQIHQPHTQFTCSSICLRFCNAFCHALAYAITANGVCLHFLVPPLAQCCFFRASCLDITAYINRWVSFREKSTLCNSFIQKRGVVLLWGWAYFQEIMVQEQDNQNDSYHEFKTELTQFQAPVVS